MKTFTDPRDNNSYEIIKIGNLYWFAESLRYQGVTHCFPNRDSDNIHRYGCLYTWEDAMKACPEGWRLPTKNEFEQLLTITGADCDSSGIRNYTWEDGFNSCGFSALPAGFRVRNSSSGFRYFGYRANFWSATPNGRTCAYYLGVHSDCASMGVNYVDLAFSVRCVKDV